MLDELDHELEKRGHPDEHHQLPEEAQGRSEATDQTDAGSLARESHTQGGRPSLISEPTFVER
ncbi:MAG: hypothetical protein ACI8UZ_001580 [Akkermansiaceae bacterium]|jgi:hypothetical protein